MHVSGSRKVDAGRTAKEGTLPPCTLPHEHYDPQRLRKLDKRIKALSNAYRSALQGVTASKRSSGEKRRRGRRLGLLVQEHRMRQHKNARYYDTIDATTPDASVALRTARAQQYVKIPYASDAQDRATPIQKRYLATNNTTNSTT